MPKQLELARSICLKNKYVYLYIEIACLIYKNVNIVGFGKKVDIAKVLG